jgi:DNA polymerase III epsilon subunit-like protein
MKPRPLISIDLETGGLYPALHPIVSISVAPSFTPERLTFYVDLTARELLAVQAKAKEVNGYDYDLWLERGALPLPMVLERLSKVLNDLMQAEPTALLVAHNAGFDRSFLDYAFESFSLDPLPRYQWRCSQQLMAQCMDDGLLPEGSLGLDRLGELSGQWPAGGRPAIHTSDQDAHACLNGYRWLKTLQAKTLLNLVTY